MAYYRICDICGAKEPEEVWFGELTVTSPYLDVRQVSIDICPECYKKSLSEVLRKKIEAEQGDVC